MLKSTPLLVVKLDLKIWINDIIDLLDGVGYYCSYIFICMTVIIIFYLFTTIPGLAYVMENDLFFNYSINIIVLGVMWTLIRMMWKYKKGCFK